MYQNEHFPGNGKPEALAEQIKAHWKEYRPSLYREAKQAGDLDRLALGRAKTTLEYAEALEKKGRDPLTAWDTAMREIALPVQQ